MLHVVGTQSMCKTGRDTLSVFSPSKSTLSCRNPHQLSIFYFNARTLLTKIDELRMHCLAKAYDVIVITVTWLSSLISDTENQPPWILCCSPRRNRHRGGVAIYLSSRIPYQELYHPHKDLELGPHSTSKNLRYVDFIALQVLRLPASIYSMTRFSP